MLCVYYICKYYSLFKERKTVMQYILDIEQNVLLYCPECGQTSMVKEGDRLYYGRIAEFVTKHKHDPKLDLGQVFKTVLAIQELKLEKMLN